MISEQAPFSHLDDRAKRVVEFAQHRAVGMRSPVIEPAHVLLALLAARRGTAARAVASLAGSRASVESAITETLVPGPRPSPAHVPFTASCEEALVRAAGQARQLGDDRIGTEHMLLGLLLTADSPAVRKLSDLGVDYGAVRAEIGRLRGDGSSDSGVE